MIPESLKSRLALQAEDNRYVLRREDELPLVRECLAELGLSDRDEIGEFFLAYRASAIHRVGGFGFELQDICSPVRSLKLNTDYIVENWGMPPDVVLLSGFEAEGGCFYWKRNKAVYDMSVHKRQDMLEGKLKPDWPGFFAFLNDYIRPPEGWDIPVE